MKPPLDNLKISKRGRDQLIKLRRVTGVESWNILARWALCVSLTEITVPPPVDRDGENPVDMNWRTFAGEYADELAAVVRVAYDEQRSDKFDIKEFTRRHVHRGLSFLEGRLGLVDHPLELFSSIARISNKSA